MHKTQTIVDQAKVRVRDLQADLDSAKVEYYTVANKVDALQLRLNEADQRVNELTAKGSLALPGRKPQHTFVLDNDMRARLECKN